MRSAKKLPGVAAALFLAGIIGMPAVAQDAKAGGAGEEFAVSDADVPEARLPVLNIGGKEDPDVYLQSLDIQVEVTGNVASTRYTMVFKSRSSRILEGELTFPLPDGRTVSHYALDINGRMREAVPVEKARAAQVFEEIQQREVDPGILERVEGNNFRTRIYPIPAKGSRTISIGYEEELSLEKNLLYYRLPMAYPNPLEKFAVKATVWKSEQKPLVPKSGDEIRFDAAGENYVAVFTRENYRPSRALIFALPAPAGIPRVMMQPAQGSYYFLASVAANLGTRKKQWGDELAVIWDVSLSGSQRNLKREMDVLNTIFAEKKNAGVHLYFLNNRLNRIANKNSANGEYRVTNGKWDELKKVLETAIFDGGTDFSQIKLDNISGNEILFFSDGISTLSDADFLKDAEVKIPVHCVVSSPKADYSAMRLIAGRSKGKFVNINALSAEDLKKELLNETPQFLGIEGGTSLSEVYPGIATPVSGNFSIAGISGADNSELTLLFGFGDKVEKRIKVKLDAKKAGKRGNVYKIWAQKKIAELDLNYEKNRAELTELGNQFGIVTRNTSLIVLELISDYIRYNIEPPASEPELLADYQRRRKGEEERLQSDSRSLLNAAVAAAENVKTWWKTEFTPPKPKYPVPDGTQPRPEPPAQTPRPLQREPDSELSRSSSSSRARASEAQAPSKRSAQSEPRRTNASAKNRAFEFEMAEVVGYMDNPAPIYIIDRDDPGAGPLSLDGPSLSNMRSSSRTGASSSSASANSPSPGLNAPASAKKAEPAPQPAIKVKAIKKDNEYMKKLTGKLADDYKTYIKLRDDYINSPTFYFDMAEWFYAKKDRETALCILTSIADLELENASLYRLLGYRFKEYGEYALQKFVCRKVIQWRPMEPQSYRDYALALADNNEAQAALDSLYSLLTKPYSANIGSRSRGIDEVAVTEMNRLIALNPKLNTSAIDKRLITDVPVDVRVVINWNMNNTDIDLHVKDPNGEECYYRRSQTKIGGRISADNTSGYGPEQFVLKKAVKGKYQVYVNHFSARDFTPDGPSTIMAEIYTKYAGESEQRRVVCLQVSKGNRSGSGNEKIEIAEFDF
ncbi:MAG: hypothetical protein FWB85_09680 [Chitinispirillia bacterium]|nr:hypothetical protein [Chitinispirillia bacterium]MCL2242450.1 hypothetical protein [Chitinispirillia bacterium]